MSEHKFSIRRRLKAFKYAFNGLSYFYRTVHNVWIHLIATTIVIGAALYFQITANDWLWIILAITVVFIAELINTAIEKAIDLTTLEHKELAKRSKDMAAGAVLLAAFFAIIVAGIIFYPYLY